MIVDEELELTTESALLCDEALHDLAADAESAARLSSKHGAEFDYIASFIAKLASERYPTMNRTRRKLWKAGCFYRYMMPLPRFDRFIMKIRAERLSRKRR